MSTFLLFYLLKSSKCGLKILSNCIVEKIPLNLGGIGYGKFIGLVDARLNGGHYFSIGSIQNVLNCGDIGAPLGLAPFDGRRGQLIGWCVVFHLTKKER